MAYDYIIQPKGTLSAGELLFIRWCVSKFKFRTILHYSTSHLVICIAILPPFPKPLPAKPPVYRKKIKAFIQVIEVILALLYLLDLQIAIQPTWVHWLHLLKKTFVNHYGFEVLFETQVVNTHMFEQPKHKLRQTNILVQANPKNNLTKKTKFSKS